MRGEQAKRVDPSIEDIGSPPHARGTEVRVDQLADDGGITPACAGNSDSRPIRTDCYADHPRMRGEQDGDRPAALARSGSPPHARGTEIQNLSRSL